MNRPPDPAPHLVDALPVRGEQVRSWPGPLPVQVTTRWSDGTVDVQEGEATQWAGEGTDRVVHVRWHGGRWPTWTSAWLPQQDVRGL